MESPKKGFNFEIKVASKEDFFDLFLCAKEFIDLIDNFKRKFFNKQFFVLTAHYNNNLIGILVAEDKSNKVASLEQILPTMYIHLLFINPKFRNNNFGKKLLNAFLTLQKEKGIASIYVKLPQKYKKGIVFFQKNNFQPISQEKSKVLLELKLWEDYGIRNCQTIEDNYNDLFE